MRPNPIVPLGSSRRRRALPPPIAIIVVVLVILAAAIYFLSIQAREVPTQTLEVDVTNAAGR